MLIRSKHYDNLASAAASASFGSPRHGAILKSRSEAKGAGAPNIVLAMLDDVGATPIAGGPVKTPALEKLVAESRRYNSFHVNVLCSPTRADLNGNGAAEACAAPPLLVCGRAGARKRRRGRPNGNLCLICRAARASD
jgi:hypothetical protein